MLVNLPSSAAGQSVQLRWNFATAAGRPDGGWFIDSVRITEPQCLAPVTNPVILNPVALRNSFNFAINTVTGRTYIIEYKTNLDDPLWQTFQTLPGNGSQQTISAPINGLSRQFFHFRMQ